MRTNQDIQSLDNLGLRAQLLFEAADNLSVTLSGDYSWQNPECCGTVFVRTGLTQRPLARQYEALAALQNYRVVSRNPFDRLTDLDAPLNAGNKIGGASLRVKWDLGQGTLTSITAWRFCRAHSSRFHAPGDGARSRPAAEREEIRAGGAGDLNRARAPRPSRGASKAERAPLVVADEQPEPQPPAVAHLRLEAVAALERVERRGGDGADL